MMSAYDSGYMAGLNGQQCVAHVSDLGHNDWLPGEWEAWQDGWEDGNERYEYEYHHEMEMERLMLGEE